MGRECSGPHEKKYNLKRVGKGSALSLSVVKNVNR